MLFIEYPFSLNIRRSLTKVLGLQLIYIILLILAVVILSITFLSKPERGGSKTITSSDICALLTKYSVTSKLTKETLFILFIIALLNAHCEANLLISIQVMFFAFFAKNNPIVPTPEKASIMFKFFSEIKLDTYSYIRLVCSSFTW